ncbi:hypothetical protein BKA66DRAFT_446866 [Pyrenochaeta sp. MPI-SDFR-AT-0127]|nr:hypothetical protein BKA66DRAFT_446866 [Pyrenochaeta sp. MPI-SDFR-AT-0127]
MDIAIVGGGIAGLSTYLHLRKHLPNPSAHTITIYESHRPRAKLLSNIPQAQNATQSLNLDTLSISTAIVGGGLGISPNGMRVLRDLDPELHDRVVAQGFPADNFVFKGANGWTLGVQSTSDKAIKGEGEAEEYVKEKGGDNVVKFAKVLGIEGHEGNGRLQVRVQVEEGREEMIEADLVIGADGVKSEVRKATISLDLSELMLVSGQSGVGGFLTSAIPSFVTTNKAMVFGFGGNGFFGYSSGGPPATQQLMWWSTFETSNLPDTKVVDPAAIKVALLQRHKHWKDPIIQEIVQKAEVESIYPTWTLPTLPHWGTRGIVLVGDAAHAMDPTTGQGASQALEDSQTLALLLAELSKEVAKDDDEATARKTIDQSIKIFHEIRSPRINAIVERGKKIAGRKANVGIVAEYFMYCFLWLLNKFPAIGE